MYLDKNYLLMTCFHKKQTRKIQNKELIIVNRKKAGHVKDQDIGDSTEI